MAVRETTLSYPSHDSMSTIRALIWEAEVAASAVAEDPTTPAGAPTTSATTIAPVTTTATMPLQRPRAVFQIIHGAAEHVERYRDFANFLVGEGFVVCANDHIGHGKSVSDPADLGHLPVKGGREALIADVHALRLHMTAHYPGLPSIMLGHSMGSFILRNYLSEHADGLAGAIISGTAQQPALLSAFGGTIARIIASLRGVEYRSSLLHNLGMGAFAKTMPNARTPFDWLSTDPKVVDAYRADAACGMVFSAGGYVSLTDLTREMVRQSSADAVFKGLPLLFIAGAEDPVGERGKGVRVAHQQYERTGLQHVALRIYEGLRHEVLNEPQREEVWRDIIDWLEDTCSIL